MESSSALWTAHTGELLFLSFSFLTFYFGRKNKWNYPLQFFVTTTNEHKIVPVGIGGMVYERESDFVWLTQSFYQCYSSIPSCMIVDGDENISNGIQSVANRIEVVIVLLLCIWHLFMAVVRALRSKGISLDPEGELKLKKKLYALQRAKVEDFELLWTKFLELYGTNDKAKAYLTDSLLAKKKRWARHATGRIFTAGMQASSIGESLHALLASGKSHFNKLHHVLMKVDCILVSQLQDSQRLSDRWEVDITKLDLASGRGFALASASVLLSSQGWNRAGEQFAASLYSGVSSSVIADPFCSAAFEVVDGRFESAVTHLVQVAPGDDSQFVQLDSVNEARRVQICAVLGKVSHFSFFFSSYLFLTSFSCRIWIWVLTYVGHVVNPIIRRGEELMLFLSCFLLAGNICILISTSSRGWPWAWVWDFPKRSARKTTKLSMG